MLRAFHQWLFHPCGTYKGNRETNKARIPPNSLEKCLCFSRRMVSEFAFVILLSIRIYKVTVIFNAFVQLIPACLFDTEGFIFIHWHSNLWITFLSIKSKMRNALSSHLRSINSYRILTTITRGLTILFKNDFWGPAFPNKERHSSTVVVCEFWNKLSIRFSIHEVVGLSSHVFLLCARAWWVVCCIDSNYCFFFIIIFTYTWYLYLDLCHKRITVRELSDFSHKHMYIHGHIDSVCECISEVVTSSSI